MLEIGSFPFFISVSMAWFLFRIIVIMKEKSVNYARELAMQAFFAYVAGLIYVTFFGFVVYLTTWHFPANLKPFTETIAMLKGARLGTSLINIFGNLMLLAPLGIFLPLINRAYREIYKVILAGLTISFSIESMQYIMMVRLFDVDDLILNTVGVIFGYSVYCILAKSKRFLEIRTSVENKKYQNPLLQIGLPIVAVSLTFTSFWLTEYFETTYPVSKITGNSMYRFVEGDVLRRYSGDRYIVIISENTKGNGQKKVSIFVKTPFQRVVPFASNSIPAPNQYGNSFSFTGNLIMDKKISYIVYGHNETGENAILKVNGKIYRESIEKGYFIVTLLTDHTEEVNISFFDTDGSDITSEFENVQ